MDLRWILPAVVVLALSFPPAGLGADPAPYRIEPPDLLRVEVAGLAVLAGEAAPIKVEHRVRPDGTLGLGGYGSVVVAGLSPAQAQSAVTRHLARYAKPDGQLDVLVEVVAADSKRYYVLAADQVHFFSHRGGETVVGAVLQVEGLAAAAKKGPVRLVRASGESLAVDWRAITREGKSATNYKVEANDRIYVGSPALR